MKAPTTRSPTTLDSQQWPGATLALPLSCQMPETCAARSGHSGKALPALSWSLQSSRWGGCCPEPAAAGRAGEAAPSQISFSTSSSCMQSKEKTEYQRSCVSWQPTGRQSHFPELYSPSSVTEPDTSLACSGNAYIFPKRKAWQDKSSQAKHNSKTETSVSLLDLFQSMCFWKSLSQLSNTKTKFSIIYNE